MDLDQAEREAFAAEVNDRLEEYNDYLLVFEKEASDTELLNKLFRIAHTIKGNAGFVGLNNMVRIAHVAESLLAYIRDQKIQLDSELATLLFESNDLMRRILDLFVDGADAAVVQVQDTARRFEEATNLRLREDYQISKKSQEPLPAKSTDHTDINTGSTPASTGDKTESTSPDAETAPVDSQADRSDVDDWFYYHIIIQLKETAPLMGMRAYLLRSKLVKIANIIKEKPEHVDYDNTGFQGNFEFHIETKASQKDLRRILRSHEIDSLEIIAQADAPESDLLVESDEFAATNQPAGAKTKSLNVSGDDLLDEADLLFTAENEAEDTSAAMASARKSISDSMDALRVPIRKVDDILNLVGELLSANSAYLSLSAEFREKFGNRGLYVHFRENSEEMARISSELQEKVMKVRMIPVGTVFNRFRRLVRDFNQRYPEKEVQLILEGEETEVDKKQIDNIYDPLLHMVRNAVDHGIESRDVRAARGKPTTGTVRLVSYQDGNSIFIEVHDDGAGLDNQRIKSKALEKGLVSAERLDSLSQRDILNLIFLPGFSTAEKVTDLSGRGVGMDVVKRNVEALGGTVSIESGEGVGSMFRFKIPLSMAIVTALKVYVREHLLAVPITVILETIKIFEKDILAVDKFETIKVRDQHVSLIRLDQEMGLPPREFGANQKKPVVIVQYGDTRIGLMVDELIGYEDMVIKSLSKNYEEIEGVAGAALLGRGEICLILDVHRLISRILEDENARFQLEQGSYVEQPTSVQVGQTGVLLPGVGAATVVSGPATTLLPESAVAPETAVASQEKEDPDRRAARTRAGLTRAQLETIKAIVQRGRRASHLAIEKLTGNSNLRLRVSSTRIQSLRKFKNYLLEQCEQGDCHAFYVGLEGDIRGNELVLINTKNILRLAAMLYRKPAFEALSMEVLSAVEEVTNIMAVSFTNAISVIAGLRVLPTPPRHLENYKDLFDESLLFENNPDANVLLIETNIAYEDNESMLSFYVLPDQRGFASLTAGNEHG